MYLRMLTTAAAALVAGTALTAPASAVAVTQSGTTYNFNGTLTGGAQNANGTYQLNDTTSFAGLASGTTVLLQVGGTTAATLSNIAVTFGGAPLALSTIPGGFSGLFNIVTNGNNNLVLTGNISSNTTTLGYNGTLSVLAAAVPEASTWAMMTLGFGALGYSLRRRRASFSLA